MKKLLFFLSITLAAVNTGYTQDIECTFCGPKLQSKTQANFNATYINHRHIVTLEKGNKMIVEMFNIKDYDVLKNTGDLLTAFRNAIEPLKDSLLTSPSANIRIDYSYNTGAEYKKIRIKKYESNGELFISSENDISRLKVEQDTVRILVHKKNPYVYKGVEYKNYRPVQLTLVLNNYTDIDSLLNNSATIQHFIDTMAKVATPKYEVWSQNYKTTINFHPYPGAPERFSGKYRFIFVEGILTDEYTHTPWIAKYISPRAFAFVADIGAGLVGNKITPMAEAGFEYRMKKMRGGSMTMIRALVAPYFLFDKSPAGKLAMYDNWFVNAEVGSLFRDKENDYVFKRHTIGVGYLIKPNGNYLTGTTMKAYLHYPLAQRFVICPEVIFTNDFRTIFPAVSIKGFLNRDY